jgi:hypothetical protein
VSAAHWKPTSITHVRHWSQTTQDNHGFLEVTRNHLHIFQTRCYSCKFQGRIFGHWHFSPYSRDVFLDYQFVSSYVTDRTTLPSSNATWTEIVENFPLPSVQDQVLPAFVLSHQVLTKTFVPNQSLPQAYPLFLNLFVVLLKLQAGEEQHTAEGETQQFW